MPSKPLKAIKPMFQRNKWRIVRGDTVKIITGKAENRDGVAKVLKVIHDKRFPRVIVEQKNMVTRHIRKDTKTGRPGFTVRMEAPIHYSNVMLVDPISGKPVRSIYGFLQKTEEEVHKVRIPRGRNATPGKSIPRPEYKPPPRMSKVGTKDTTRDDATLVTYDAASDFLPSYLPRALREHVPHVPQGLRSYYTIARPSGSIFFSSSSSSSSGGSSSSSSSEAGYSSQQEQQQQQQKQLLLCRAAPSPLSGNSSRSSSSLWRYPWQQQLHHLSFAACAVC